MEEKIHAVNWATVSEDKVYGRLEIKKKSGLFEHGTFRQVAMEICSRTQQYVEEDYPRCVEKNGWRINL